MEEETRKVIINELYNALNEKTEYRFLFVFYKEKEEKFYIIDNHYDSSDYMRAIELNNKDNDETSNIFDIKSKEIIFLWKCSYQINFANNDINFNKYQFAALLDGISFCWKYFGGDYIINKRFTEIFDFLDQDGIDYLKKQVEFYKKLPINH